MRERERDLSLQAIKKKAIVHLLALLVPDSGHGKTVTDFSSRAVLFTRLTCSKSALFMQGCSLSHMTVTNQIISGPGIQVAIFQTSPNLLSQKLELMIPRSLAT